jgi:renalase
VTADAPIIVIGAGISGVACARRLHDAGLAVRILERSHRLGGRMAVRTERAAGRSHAVDLGAPYFTVRDPGFASVADGWERSGRARRWTDTFCLSGPGGPRGTTSGPLRWSSTGGLRSLVEDLAQGLDVRLRHEVRAVSTGPDGAPLVDTEPARALVLAMPDPQAARLLPAPVASQLGVDGRAWEPALSVWAAWPQRWWPDFDGIFVDGSPVMSWVADSGRSRGDGAPVLVAHTTSAFAQERLDDVSSAVDPVLAELPAVIGGGSMPQPSFSRVHRWALASARHLHAEPFAMTDQLIGVCGDAWGERSRVEQAWLSGTGLARALLGPLTVSSNRPQR